MYNFIVRMESEITDLTDHISEREMDDFDKELSPDDGHDGDDDDKKDGAPAVCYSPPTGKSLREVIQSLGTTRKPNSKRDFVENPQCSTQDIAGTRKGNGADDDKETCDGGYDDIDGGGNSV